jgi:hypothetical protein
MVSKYIYIFDLDIAKEIIVSVHKNYRDYSTHHPHPLVLVYNQPEEL